jgi:hypothetical protein
MTVLVSTGRRVADAVIVGARVRAAVAITSRTFSTAGIGVSSGVSVAEGSVAVAMGGAGVSVGGTSVLDGVGKTAAASSTVASGVSVASGSVDLLAMARGPTSILANPSA